VRPVDTRVGALPAGVWTGDGGHAVGLQDELVGTFELVGLESRHSDGVITRPYGDHPIGIFMFGASGRFSVQVTAPETIPPTNYLAMFGTYVVEDDRRAFILTPRGASDPQLLGTEVLRHVTLDGELAVFNTPTTDVDGVEVTTYITWRRVADR
jgi:hypothetical protein